MAQHYIGLNKGQVQVMGNLQNATVGTATGSTDMELRWDDTKGITRLELKQFTEFLEYYIEQDFNSGAALPPL